MIATPSIGSKAAPREFLNRSLKLFMTTTTTPLKDAPTPPKKRNSGDAKAPIS